MSTYQLVVTTVSRGFDLSRLQASFWKWWAGLYADAPRRLPPML